jgi:hypothetical protein
MSPLATVANWAWLAASAPAHARFVRALRDPAGAQRIWLRAHLCKHASSAYGRSLGLGEIRDYEDFARRVPVVDYDDLAPWIARIRRGETDVLTREPVTRLLPTSGTSGARKLIPFTASLQHEFNAAIGPWFVDLWRQQPSIALGPAYWSLTPALAARDDEPSAVPIGFDTDSRHLGGARARLVAVAMAVPSAVAALQYLAEFRRAVLRHLLACADLRFISVWHPSFLSLLLDTLEREWPVLSATLPSSRRHPDPTRLWPNLRVVSCWADAHAAAPARDLALRLPGVTIQPKGLLATEAFVTLPFGGAHPLAVRSHFFEFEDEHGAVHPAEAIRAGETYAVIVTTGGGLWRYRLGDRVTVTDFVGRTPSLRFLGRGSGSSDLCGEKLTEAFVITVLAEHCPGAAFAMLAPEAHSRGWRYVLFIEGGPHPCDLEPRLDTALRANPHYALCRDLGQLAALSVASITSGYERYVAAEMARGLRLGDIKPVALSTRTDWRGVFAADLAVSSTH